MLKFLARTENTEKKDQKNRIQSRESSPNYRSVKLVFAILPYKLNESRAVSFLEKNKS